MSVRFKIKLEEEETQIDNWCSYISKQYRSWTWNEWVGQQLYSKTNCWSYNWTLDSFSKVRSIQQGNVQIKILTKV